MRHNKKFNHLGRKSAHRKAMLSNMASSLIESKRITTTVAKAKELRTYVEPLITKAKNDTTHSRRMVFRYLQDKNAVSELFRDVADKVGDRPGGYTRILRTGDRYGDNAEMCIIELVDYNEAMLATGEEAEKTKRRRSRRGGSSKKAKTPVTGTTRGKTGEQKKKAVKEESKSEEGGTKESPEAKESQSAEKKDEKLVAETNDDLKNREEGEAEEKKQKSVESDSGEEGQQSSDNDTSNS
jgi:large subunit ribosomal protein L17